MRSSRTFAAWLAILAMAMQALWPLAAQARPGDPGLQVPICAVGGEIHYVALPGPDTPLEKRAAIHGEHCAFCAFGAEAPALPVRSTGVPLRVEPRGERPFDRTPSRVSSVEPWLDSPPRAPPFSSL